jgi:hypothetical protein
MAINGADVERADRAAAGAVNVKPPHASHQRGPDRRRPPHVAPGREVLIPSLDDAPSFKLSGICFGPRPPL